MHFSIIHSNLSIHSGQDWAGMTTSIILIMLIILKMTYSFSKGAGSKGASTLIVGVQGMKGWYRIFLAKVSRGGWAVGNVSCHNTGQSVRIQPLANPVLTEWCCEATGSRATVFIKSTSAFQDTTLSELTYLGVWRIITKKRICLLSLLVQILTWPTKM